MTASPAFEFATAGRTKPDGTHWTDQAACHGAGVDPEWFFPVGETGPALVDVAAAKRVCAGCAVQPACLDWAVRTGEPIGIWGGATPAERALLRSARRSPPPAGHAMTVSQGQHSPGATLPEPSRRLPRSIPATAAEPWPT